MQHFSLFCYCNNLNYVSRFIEHENYLDGTRAVSYTPTSHKLTICIFSIIDIDTHPSQNPSHIGVSVPSLPLLRTTNRTTSSPTKSKVLRFYF